MVEKYDVFYQKKGMFSRDYDDEFIADFYDQETKERNEVTNFKLHDTHRRVFMDLPAYSPEGVWSIMQNIDEDRCFPSKINERSMMVGDIIVDKHDKVAWLVRNFGMLKIPLWKINKDSEGFELKEIKG